MSDAPETFQYQVSQAIREIAMALPDASEGTSCVNRAFKAGGKNFAFVGEKDEGTGLRLKLGESIAEVQVLAESDPDRYQVGKGGWSMLRFPLDHEPSLDELNRWVTESFRLLVPKKISAQLG